MVLVSVLLSCYLRRGWFIVCYYFFHYLLCNGQRKKEATGYFEKKWKLLFSGYLVMLWSVIPSTVLMIAWYSLVSVSVWFSCKLSVVCLMKLQWQCVWWSCNMSVLTEHLFRVPFMCCVYGDLWTDTAHLLLALGSGLVSSQNGFSATNRSEYFQGSGFNYTNNSRIATVRIPGELCMSVTTYLNISESSLLLSYFHQAALVVIIMGFRPRPRVQQNSERFNPIHTGPGGEAESCINTGPLKPPEPKPNHFFIFI